MQEFVYVDTPDALEAACRAVEDATWVALDTEFVREKTYFPKLCLIQIAVPGLIACIDPLRLPVVDSLLDLLYRPTCLKVLHASFQDLEIFHWLKDRPPVPVFDTQTAAAILGLGEQLSYAALVQQLLGVKLDKLHTRTDWSARPLDQAQLRYAAEDVFYLAQIYPILREALAAKGRLAWVEEECLLLGDPLIYGAERRLQWRKLPGANEFGPQKLAALRALALWRERQAVRDNRPRQWILSDSALSVLADRLPRNSDELSRIEGFGAAHLKRLGDAVLKTIDEALNESPAAWPRAYARPSREQMSAVQALMQRVRDLAAAHRISPALLATRAELEALVRGEEVQRLAQGWRSELLAPALSELADRTNGS